MEITLQQAAARSSQPDVKMCGIRVPEEQQQTPHSAKEDPKAIMRRTLRRSKTRVINVMTASDIGAV